MLSLSCFPKSGIPLAKERSKIEIGEHNGLLLGLHATTAVTRGFRSEGSAEPHIWTEDNGLNTFRKRA